MDFFGLTRKSKAVKRGREVDLQFFALPPGSRLRHVWGMTRLRSRTESPVNGFQIHIPETGFQGHWWSFADAVAAVRAHLDGNLGVARRFANLPRTTAETEMYVDHQNAVRMLGIRGAAAFVVQDAQDIGASSFFPISRNPGPSVAGGVRRMATGAAALLEWLGDGGKPVAAELAEARAAVCARCPQNAKGDWTRLFTEPAAAIIRTQLALRGDLKLRTQHDDALVVCQACGCPLKLKVHVPLAQVAGHTSAETRAKLDPACWILSEKL